MSGERSFPEAEAETWGLEMNSFAMGMILESGTVAAPSELASQVALEEVSYSFRTSVPMSRGRFDTCRFEHRSSAWISATTAAVC